MNYRIQLITLAGLSIGFAFSTGQTQAKDPGEGVVARYTFDGLETEGTEMRRSHETVEPFNGADYVPKSENDEFGPTLENPGGMGRPEYYRSYINNSASEATDGRQVLDLRQHHPHFQDTYRTKIGEKVLPEKGSFTWEMVIRVEEFAGANNIGLLIDATTGVANIFKLPPDSSETAVATRLWLRPVEGREGVFEVCFSVPINEKNEVATIAAEVEYQKWIHLAAVYDDEARMSELYINGELLAAEPVSSFEPRGAGFGLAGAFSPEVERVDHKLRLNKALIDEIAMTRDARKPGNFVLGEKIAP